MLLRIQEEMPEGKLGIRFYFQIPQVADGTEWLMTNGFQHHTTQSPENDYWTREGTCAVTFKNGIFDDGQLMMARAKNTLRADFVYELELTDVTCEDL
jgi:hypothetical protein